MISPRASQGQRILADLTRIHSVEVGQALFRAPLCRSREHLHRMEQAIQAQVGLVLLEYRIHPESS